MIGMKRTYANYTDEDIIKYSKEAKSMADLLVKLGLKPVGGNYANLKRKLQTLGLTCNHWKGTGWSAGQQLKDWQDYSRPSGFKKHLIKQRGHQCEDCKLTHWKDSFIPLEIHHLDGHKGNNNPDNLQLLCCNCHALTGNWRNKKVVGRVGLEPTNYEA